MKKYCLLLLLILGLFGAGGEGYGQSGIVGNGFCPGWANGDIVVMAASAGGSQIVTRNPTVTGNRYFRLIRNTNVNMSPSAGCLGGGDQDITANLSSSIGINNAGPCGNGAWFINCPNTTDNYIFKLPAVNSSASFVCFRVQGAVRTIGTVTQNQPTVYINQQVVVTATLNDNLNSGQAVYLRYTTNAFSTSTVLPMTGSGTTYTATLPGQVAGTLVTYYTFTSGTTNVAANGNNADYFSINLNNNGGANYSYNVQNGYASAQTGNWNSGTTWAGSSVPPAGANVVILNGHNITLDVNATAGSLIINTGGTFTGSDAFPRTLNILANTTATTLTNNGTWANGPGGSMVDFRSDNTINHTVTGNIGFQNVSITRNSGAPNIGVNFGTGSIVNGNFQINAGGFVTTNAPTYGGSSTLIYATGTTYGRSLEWSAISGQGFPANVTLINNTTLDMPNNGNTNLATVRNCAGSLTINTGSTLSMTGVIGTGNMTGAMSVGGNVLINGALILSVTANGNLNVAGNFTNSGTFTANSRTVTFNGTSNQAITGNTTFAVLVNSNSTGVVSIPAATQITLATTGTFTTAGSSFVINGTLINNGTVTLNNASAGVTVNGTLTNTNAVSVTNGSLTFSGTGIYNHNLNGGVVPTATWAVTSNCNILGVTTTIPTASTFDQSFGNLTWNSTAQSGNLSFGSNLKNIGGNLRILSTGTGSIRLAATVALTTTIGGYFEQSDGILILSTGSSNPTIIIAGNFTQSGGTLDFLNGGTVGSIFNVAGTVSQTGGSITRTTGGSHVCTFGFNGPSNQSINFGGTINNAINFRCNNPNGITITGSLPINQDATFFRTQGAITGTVAYNSTNSILQYDGGSLITSDAEWPATNGPTRVTLNTTNINNTITMHASRSLPSGTNGVLTLTSGRLVQGNFNLTLLNSATTAISWVGTSDCYISQTGNGQLIRALANSTDQTYSFPIGNASGLTQFGYFSATNSLAGRQLGVRTITGASANINNPNTPPDYLNRYFVTSVNDNSGTYSYRISQTGYLAGEVTGNVNDVKISSFLSNIWTDLPTASGNPLTSASGTYTQITAPLTTGHFSGRNSSATYTWTGTTNTSWATATNWTPNGFPSPTDNIVVNVPGTNQLNINELREISSVTINGTGVVNIGASGDLRVLNTFTLAASGQLNGASGALLRLEGDISYASPAVANLNCASNVQISRTTAVTVPAWQYGNLITTGGARTLSPTGTISICGTYTAVAATTITGSTVSFNGSGVQVVPNTHNYNSLIIANTFADVTLAGNVSLATLSINQNARFDIAGRTVTVTGASSTINGILRCASTTGTLSFTNPPVFSQSGVYEHNFNGGTIPTATWTAGTPGASCVVMGATTNAPAGLGQSFFNFSWSNAGQSQAIGLGGNLATVNGNFEINNTNGRNLNLTDGANVSLAVAGNVLLSGGSLNLSSGSGNGTILVRGNLQISGSNSVNKAGGSGVGLIEFNGTNNQSITIPGTSNVNNAVNFRLNNSAGITIPNGSVLPINDNATFYRRNGSITLISSGNIHYLAASSVLEYDPSGSITLTTSSAEWPDAGHNRVRINSTSSNAIALHANREITLAGSIDFVAGRLALGSFNLTVQNNAVASLTRTSGYAVTDGNGQLLRAILTSAGPHNYVFPVGNVSSYTPLALSFNNNNVVNRLVGVRSVGTVHPFMAPNPADYLNNRYWVTTLNDASGTYSYTPSFTYIGGDIFGNASNVRLSRWNGSVWSNTSNSSSSGTTLTTGVPLTQITGNLANAGWSGRTIKTPVDYTWSFVGGGIWTTPTNWTPNGIPTTEDIVRFTHAGNYTVSNVPTGITLRNLLVSGTGTTTLTTASAGSISLFGGTNPVLSVGSGSTLIVSGTQTLNTVILSGGTGTVAGNVQLRAEGSVVSHSLEAQGAGGLTFNNGSYFTSGSMANANYSGNPFGDGVGGSVIFAIGSVFEQVDGGNPFGTNNVAAFQSGSLYKYSENNFNPLVIPSFSGRTYANFEYNSTQNKSVTGTSAFTVDNLTVTQGTFNINTTGTPGHSIRGNVTVANGASLHFSPASGGTINLSGSGVQNISGVGGLTVGSNATLTIANTAGVNLQKDITVNGALNIAANGIFNATATNIVSGTGSFNLQSDGIFGAGSPDGLFGSLSSGNIRTTVRTVSSGASVRYNGLTAQNTGDFTTSTPNTLKAIYINNSAGVSLSAVSNGINLGALTLESGNFSIGNGQLVNIATGGTVTGIGGDFATGTAGGILNFAGAGTFSGTCNPYNVYISGGVNFGSGNVTIQNNGRLRINSGGFVTGNAPLYAPGALLQYSTGSPVGSPYGRGLEWSATSGKGYPAHVQLSNNTHVDMGANSGTASFRQCSGDLTIDAGSAFYMDYGTNDMTQAVGVLGDVTNNGTLSLSEAGGGDFELGGNWFLNTGATFNPRLREVRFNGSAPQNIEGSQTSFDYLRINNPAGVSMSTATTALFLTMQNGLFTPGPTNALSIKAGGTITNSGVGFNGSLPANSTGGNIQFLGAGTVTASQTIGLSFWDVWVAETVTAQPLNFGSDAGVPTVLNTMTLNANRFLQNAPAYANTSTLVYNSGGTYNRNVEWGATSGRGYPNNVRIQNGTTVNLSNNAANFIIGMGGDLELGYEFGGGHGHLDFGTRAYRVFVNGDVTIGTNSYTGSLTLGLLGTAPNAGDLEIGGSYTRTSNGTFNANNRAVFFTGSTIASINAPSPGPEPFPFIIVDKGGSPDNSLTLNRAVDITTNGKFTLTSGRVITTTANILRITNSAPDIYPSSGAVDVGDTTITNNNGYVDGPMSRLTIDTTTANDDQRYLFPVGQFIGGTHFYKRMWIRSVTNTSGGKYFTVQYVRARPPGNSPWMFQSDLTGIRANEYWDVQREAGSSAEARLVMPYNHADPAGWFQPSQASIPMAVNSNVAVVRGEVISLNDYNWNYTGPNDFVFSNDGDAPEARSNALSGDVTSRLITEFSPFTFGFGKNSILPLRLLTFTVALHGPDALLHWTLADAKDLKLFEVEHSNDGQAFTRLAIVGHNGSTYYHYRHAGLQPGVHYYRLKMVEKDGRNGYSKVEVLMVNTNRTLIAGLMHNPIQGGRAVVKLYSATNQDAEAMVMDMAGRMLLRQKLTLQTGYNQPSLSLMPLPAGMYKMLIRTRDGVEKVITVMK